VRPAPAPSSSASSSSAATASGASFITQTAYACGWADPSSFIAAFTTISLRV